MKFNHDKCKYVRFGSGDKIISDLVMDGCSINPVTYSKYLGHIIGCNDNAKNIQLALQEFYTRVNMINAQFCYISSDVKY